MVKDRIRGGKADRMPDSMFNESQIRKGARVEREHTSDRSLRREIAKDHLAETDINPSKKKVYSTYYDHLEYAEKRSKNDKMRKYNDVFVDSYTRSDGTRVKAHRRRIKNY